MPLLRKILSLKFYLLLALLVVVFYWPLIANFNSLTFGKDLASNWMFAFYTKYNFWEYGQYALWNHQFLSGFPMDTSNLAAIFYPPHWLFIFLPLKLSFNLLTLAHVYLIGVGVFILCKSEFRLSNKSAFFAAISVMLSPKIFNHNDLGHFNLVESIPWVILSLMFFLKAIRTNKLYFALVSGVFLSLSILVFSIFYIYALFCLGFATLVITSTRLLNKEKFWVPIVHLITSVVFSLGLSGVFLLPFLQFSSLSLRSKLGFWEGAFPSIYKDTLAQLFYLFPHKYHDSETLIYIGVFVLGLALVGLWSFRKRKEVWILGLIAMFSLSVSFGANEIFYKIYYVLLSVFHFMRAPLRIWILFIISMGILSGFGMEYLTTRFSRLKNYLFVGLTVLTLITFVIYAKDYFHLVDYDKEESRLLDLIPNDGNRVYCLNNCLFTPEVMKKGYQLASGGEVVMLKNYYDYVRAAGGYKFDGYSLSVPPYQIFGEESIYFEKQSPNPELLGKLNIKYVVAPYELINPGLKQIGLEGRYFVYENLAVLPRSYLENSLTPLIIKKYTPNEVTVSLTVGQDERLVLADLYYPGWKVFDNGLRKEIEAKDNVVRAVNLEKGTHEVTFRYESDLGKIGLLLSLLSLVFFLGVSYRRLKLRF